LLDLLQQALRPHGLQPADLSGLASSSHKRDEPGLRQLAEHLNLPLVWLSASQLNDYHQRLGQTSALSLQITGSAGVAEASALAQAEALSGQRAELLGAKLRSANATCALARAQLLEIA
jgi:cobalt-precorrin 5A hydrolase